MKKMLYFFNSRKLKNKKFFRTLKMNLLINTLNYQIPLSLNFEQGPKTCLIDSLFSITKKWKKGEFTETMCKIILFHF